MKAIEQMQAYIKQIRAADKAYYNAGNPMLTDYEYCLLYTSRCV